jgi:antimicrobial peptide system SdpA family protein
MPIQINRIKIIFYGSIFLYTAILVSALSIFLGYNPLNKLNENKGEYTSIFPQGWAFFTKSVVQPTSVIYKVESNRLEEVDLRAFQYQYAFGLSRKNRLEAIDMGTAVSIINGLPEKNRGFNKVVKINADVHTLINPDTLRFAQINNNNRFVVLKGKYIAVLKEFLPWSLLRSPNVKLLKQSWRIVPFEITDKINK